MHGKNSTVVVARLPDVVIERIKSDELLGAELTIGLRVKKILLDLYGDSVEAVDVKTAKAI
jgi:hypothetical protein